MNVPKNPYWMPFTDNRAFFEKPRVISKAEHHHYIAQDGTRLYDTFSGLWTSGIGHCHPKIVEAVQQQVATLDMSMGFQVTNDRALALAERITNMAPAGINHCFFTNSGSEAADTALKIALGYQRLVGDGHRTRLIGREKGYHGTNFGGMSVGGILPNRKMFSPVLLPGVDHIRHTLNQETSAFCRGQPVEGAYLADDLERLVTLHDASNIAAVIVEPVSGSGGIIVPPINYLQRLREICTRHGILLIFDEVITAFGRLGHDFAAHRFDVIPDIITTAKGLTNGVVPMGAVLVSNTIYDAFMSGAEQGIELFHGYTYSGHPVAAAAGLATLEIYQTEGIFEQALALEPLFEDLIHSFDDHPLVIDVRNLGLMGAIEMAPRENAPGARGLETHERCFYNEQTVVRHSADTLQFSPFLNSKPDEVEGSFRAIRRVLDSLK